MRRTLGTGKSGELERAVAFPNRDVPNRRRRDGYFWNINLRKAPAAKRNQSFEYSLRTNRQVSERNGQKELPYQENSVRNYMRSFFIIFTIHFIIYYAFIYCLKL